VEGFDAVEEAAGCAMAVEDQVQVRYMHAQERGGGAAGPAFGGQQALVPNMALGGRLELPGVFYLHGSVVLGLFSVPLAGGRKKNGTK
jgi:hypothetical protein